MNISGVSPAAAAANNVSLESTASIKVMNMAEDVTEDVMGKLLESMNTMITGLGGSIDQSV